MSYAILESPGQDYTFFEECGAHVCRAVDWMGAARGTLDTEASSLACSPDVVVDSQLITSGGTYNDPTVREGNFDSADDTLVIPLSTFDLSASVNYEVWVSCRVDGTIDGAYRSAEMFMRPDTFSSALGMRIASGARTFAGSWTVAGFQFRGYVHASLGSFLTTDYNLAADDIVIKAFFIGPGTSAEFRVDQVVLIPADDSQELARTVPSMPDLLTNETRAEPGPIDPWSISYYDGSLAETVGGDEEPPLDYQKATGPDDADALEETYYENLIAGTDVEEDADLFLHVLTCCPEDGVMHTDDFTRTVSNAWGRTATGAWGWICSTTTPFSVDGSRAVFTFSTAAATLHAYYGEQATGEEATLNGIENFEIQAQFEVTSPPVNTGDSFLFFGSRSKTSLTTRPNLGVALVWQGSDTIDVRLIFFGTDLGGDAAYPDGDNYLALTNAYDLDTPVTGVSYTPASDLIWIKFRQFGPNYAQCKVWMDGDSEPDWMLEGYVPGAQRIEGVPDVKEWVGSPYTYDLDDVDYPNWRRPDTHKRVFPTVVAQNRSGSSATYYMDDFTIAYRPQGDDPSPGHVRLRDVNSGQVMESDIEVPFGASRWVWCGNRQYEVGTDGVAVAVWSETTAPDLQRVGIQRALIRPRASTFVPQIYRFDVAA